MDRNAKIALGCGGAGCLGLIVVIIAGVAIYWLSARSGSTTNRNDNFNSNRSRSDSPINSNSNSESNSNESASSSSSLSEDDQHRLFHAASATGDAEVLRRVRKKLGLLNSDNTPSEKTVDFAAEHVGWLLRNSDFVQSMNTPAKARDYVDKHIND